MDREELGSVESMLQHARACSLALGGFESSDWPRLRGRDDFDSIYWLPASQRSALERVYLDGRDFARQLASGLGSLDTADAYPSFEAFVAAAECCVSSRPAKLAQTLHDARRVLADLDDPPRSIELMVELAKRQLDMLAVLDGWLRAVRLAPSDRQAAPVAAGAGERAAGFWRRHAWALALFLVAAALGVVLVVALR